MSKDPTTPIEMLKESLADLPYVLWKCLRTLLINLVIFFVEKQKDPLTNL